MREHLAEFLAAIVGDRNPLTAPAEHARIPGWIAARWRKLGVDAEVHEFTVGSTVGRNVWVEPTRRDAPFVLVIAHHDTVPNCPGADDNASGVAVADAVVAAIAGGMEANVAVALVDFEEGHPARWLARSAAGGVEDESFREQFAATYGEGPLLFPGARELLQRLRAEGLVEHLEVVLNFEAVGWTAAEQQLAAGVELDEPPQGNFVAIIGNETATGWVQRLSAASPIPTFPLIVPGEGHAIPDTRRSDHAVFWDAGIAAVMLTDTAELRNPHYHQPTDTEVDLEFLAGVVEMAREAIG